MVSPNRGNECAVHERVGHFNVTEKDGTSFGIVRCLRCGAEADCGFRHEHPFETEDHRAPLEEGVVYAE